MLNLNNSQDKIIIKFFDTESKKILYIKDCKFYEENDNEIVSLDKSKFIFQDLDNVPKSLLEAIMETIKKSL